MSRYTQTDISSIAGVNSELTKVATAIDTLLDRDGTIPNQMETDIDVNSNDILNASNVNSDSILLAGSPITATVGTIDLAGTFNWTGIQNFTSATVSGIDISVGDLTEVAADTPVNNDIIRFNGTNWVLADINSLNYTWTGTHNFTSATVTGIGVGTLTEVAADTPVNNDIIKFNGSVWVLVEALDALPLTGGSLTGDIDSTGSIDLTATAASQIQLPLSNDAATPTIAFGDGDTGFYEESDDVLVVDVGLIKRFSFRATDFRAEFAPNTGAAVRFLTATATVPGLVPNVGDTDTGIGQAGADQLSLIAGGVEGLRVEAATLTVPTGTWDADGIDINTGDTYQVNSVPVVGAQGAAVADATDAATVITQLNALLSRLRTHGLIAT